MSRDTSKPPPRLRVVVCGGGVAGVETMLALRALAGDRVDLELIAPETHFWYRPLAVSEPFAAGRVRSFELAAVAGDCRARFTLGTLQTVDPDGRVARTTNGLEVSYDVLVLACGARPEPPLDDALTFRGPADSDRFGRLLERFEHAAGHLVVALPDGPVWPLPAYELALMSGRRLAKRPDATVSLVTPERRPLEIFGTDASAAVEQLLADVGVAVHVCKRPLAAADGLLSLHPSGELPCDGIAVLARLRGPGIPHLPSDADGFVATDGHGRVLGLDDVYAAGDATSFSIKQGGIAAQQADAAAEAIAARAGAAVRPRPFRPVLHGVLLTGGEPLYLRAEWSGNRAGSSAVASEPLWWPPAKIMGRYLAPYLADRVSVTAASGE